AVMLSPPESCPWKVRPGVFGGGYEVPNSAVVKWSVKPIASLVASCSVTKEVLFQVLIAGEEQSSKSTRNSSNVSVNIVTPPVFSFLGPTEALPGAVCLKLATLGFQSTPIDGSRPVVLDWTPGNM